LFFEFARAAKEVNHQIFIAENVRDLLNHDDGKTLETIATVIEVMNSYTQREEIVSKELIAMAS
jgi:DNA (cytosine-5)-methyltransferase 1